MLCPNCGTKTTSEHKFCRNCGMNLEPVSRALAAHLSHGGAASALAAREVERRAARRMMKGLVTGVVVILFGLLLLGVMPGKGFKFLGIATALLGVVFSLVSVLSSMSASARADAALASPPSPTHTPEAAQSTGRLLHESRIEPASSVTDHTTELLGVEIKDRKARD
ncbi:MAG TPA: zinc-ribbon domain-containing protein [Pyrinomonadaceae bacterium]|jgi:predicted lipid-binding transport protein (Tim44 family)